MTDEAARTAAQCRHYAMCKIDYLETGLCPSGPRKHYVAYYPQGRMDLYAALANGRVPVTPALIDVAQTCTLCGICDRQCHFVAGLAPLPVMEALKARVSAHLAAGDPVFTPAEDAILRELRDIVGAEWASNDPAILVTYADDPYPLKGPQMPRYVVLPGSTAEVAAVVGLARKHDLPYAVRGNGASVYGMVFSDGLVLDTNRMREIEIDTDNWTATAGAGVPVFDLQREAARHCLRINAAEPAATVCGNIICTGLFSPWSATYGTFADNFVDMEFVDAEGQVFCLNDRESPNLFAYDHAVRQVPAICTRAMVRLHPTTEDEEALLVPFPDFTQAVRFARELGTRRIGIAIAVLGAHYLATFVAPTLELASRLKGELGRALGFEYAVLVVADRYGREAIRQTASSVIDSELARTLILGLPRLLDGEWLELVRELNGNKRPYEILCRPELSPLVETVLDPAPETVAGSVDEDRRPFYAALFARPQYSNMAWLTTFRIVSCRMARHAHVFAFLIYVPLDQIDLIVGMNEEFERVAERYEISHDYGFLTPVDLGKRGVLEYDYYIDQTDPAEREKAAAAMEVLVPWLDELARTETGVTWIKTFFSQGCARKEGLFYRGFKERGEV